MAEVMRLLYIVQHAVAAKNEVLQLLISKGHFDLESPYNGLFLSTDPGLAKSTGTPLYPANYTPINEKHDEILKAFGERQTPFGMSNLQLMKASSMTAEQRAAQEQLFQEGTKLVNDLRDLTKMAILKGKLKFE